MQWHGVLLAGTAGVDRKRNSRRLAQTKIVAVYRAVQILKSVSR